MPGVGAGPSQYGFGKVHHPSRTLLENKFGALCKGTFQMLGLYFTYCGYLFFQVPDRGFQLAPCIDVDAINLDNLNQRCERLEKWNADLQQKSLDGYQRDFRKKDEFLREVSQILPLEEETLKAKVPGRKDDITVATLLFKHTAPIAQYYQMYDVLDHLANRYETVLGSGSKAPGMAREGKKAAGMCALAYQLDHITNANLVDSETRCRVCDSLDSLRAPKDLRINGNSVANDLVVIPVKDAKDNTKAILFEDKEHHRALMLCMPNNTAWSWIKASIDVRLGNLHPLYHSENMAKKGYVHKGLNDEFERLWESPQIPEHLKTGDTHMTVVGHSLGGGLGQLFASAFAQNGPDRPVQVFTAASPRIFTPGAALSYEMVPNLSAVRCFNQFDVAAKVPSKSRGFEHCGLPLPVFLPPRVSNNLSVFAIDGFKLWHGWDSYRLGFHETAFIQTSVIGEKPARYMDKYL